MTEINDGNPTSKDTLEPYDWRHTICQPRNYLYEFAAKLNSCKK